MDEEGYVGLVRQSAKVTSAKVLVLKCQSVCVIAHNLVK